MPVGRPYPDQVAHEARRLLSDLTGYSHRQTYAAHDVDLVARLLADWYALADHYARAQAQIRALTDENAHLRARVGGQGSVWHWLKFLLGIESCPSQP